MARGITDLNIVTGAGLATTVRDERKGAMFRFCVHMLRVDGRQRRVDRLPKAPKSWAEAGDRTSIRKVYESRKDVSNVQASSSIPCFSRSVTDCALVRERFGVCQHEERVPAVLSSLMKQSRCDATTLARTRA